MEAGDRRRAWRPWRRWAVAWVAASYVLIGAAVLSPSIRPGRTLVAADLVTLVAPYSEAPHAAPHNPLLTDVPYQFFPWFRFVGTALRETGHMPGWNPQVLGGVPVTPNGYFATSYPPVWIVRFLDPFDAYNALVLLHLVVAALGIYAFSRVLGARRVAAWLAGMLAFVAAFWVHWSTHLFHLVAFAGLPWALAATHLLVVKPSRLRVGALAAVVGLWWLGGNPQFVYDGTLFVAVYGIALLVWQRVRSGGKVVRPVLAAAAAVVLGIGLAAPALLPEAAYSSQVLRVHEPAPDRHVPVSEAIRVLVPDATGNPVDGVSIDTNDELRMDSPFLGLTAVLLASAAVAGWRRGSRLLLFGGAAVVLLLAYTSFVHAPLYALLPGYDRFRAVPHRWLSVLPAVVLPLAALGLDDLLAGERGARRGILLAAGGSIVVVAGWLAVQGIGGDNPMGYLTKKGALAVAVLVITTVVVGSGVAIRHPPVALVLALVCISGELFFNTTKWYPRVEERTAYPSVPVATVALDRGGRVALVGPAAPFPTFAPDLAMAYGAADAEGVVSLFPKEVDRYLRLVDDYGLYALGYNLAPPVADGAKVASPLLDALDVRTVVVPPGSTVPAGLQLLQPGDPAVYARPSPGGAVVVADASPATAADMWRSIAAPDWDPSRTSAVVGLPRRVAGGPGTAGHRSVPARTPDRDAWDVDAPAGGFLRVSGNFDDGWSATIDGRTTKVYLADGIFRGVVVPPGRHSVVFTFHNGDESHGRAVALVALAVLLVLVVPVPRRAECAKKSILSTFLHTRARSGP